MIVKGREGNVICQHSI